MFSPESDWHFTQPRIQLGDVRSQCARGGCKMKYQNYWERSQDLIQTRDFLWMWLVAKPSSVCFSVLRKELE